jgi:hypothetical protein
MIGWHLWERLAPDQPWQLHIFPVAQAEQIARDPEAAERGILIPFADGCLRFVLPAERHPEEEEFAWRIEQAQDGAKLLLIEAVTTV